MVLKKLRVQKEGIICGTWYREICIACVKSVVEYNYPVPFENFKGIVNKF